VLKNDAMFIFVNVFLIETLLLHCLFLPWSTYGLPVNCLGGVSNNPVGGMVASWLVHLSPDQAVQVQALAGGIVLMFLGRTLKSHSASLHPVV